jgi:hypothetical protein
MALFMETKFWLEIYSVQHNLFYCAEFWVRDRILLEQCLFSSRKELCKDRWNAIGDINADFCWPLNNFF